MAAENLALKSMVAAKLVLNCKGLIVVGFGRGVCEGLEDCAVGLRVCVGLVLGLVVCKGLSLEGRVFGKGLGLVVWDGRVV